MTKSGLLRALPRRPGLVPVVGAHDALSVTRGETVGCVNVFKGWLEVDTFEDYPRAWAAIKS